MSENFEGTFPSPGWQSEDANGAGVGRNLCWGVTNHDHRGGFSSAWPAAGCSDHGDSENVYPVNLHSIMKYGPFSLVDASTASLSFSYKNQSSAADELSWLVSLDNTSWYGYKTSGSSNGWVTVSFDLSNNIPSINSVTGASQVWLAFVFQSDAIDEQAGGPYIDDISLNKNPGPDLLPTISPYNPWVYPLIISATDGDFTPGNPLSPSQPIYVSWVIQNAGQSTGHAFSNCIFINDTPVQCWRKSGLAQNGITYIENWPISPLVKTGWNRVTLVADVYDEVDETDETNNVFPDPETFTAQTLPYEYAWGAPAAIDLLPVIPDGWAYPVQPANSPGEPKPGPLFTGTSTYISVAIRNPSTLPAPAFTTCLSIDANPTPWHCWNEPSGVSAGTTQTHIDEILTAGFLSPGVHTLQLTIDPEDSVQEANEDNNTWTHSFYWYAGQSCAPVLPNNNANAAQFASSGSGQSISVSLSGSISTLRLPYATQQIEPDITRIEEQFGPPPGLVMGWWPVLYEDFEGNFPDDRGWILANNWPITCNSLWGSDTLHSAPSSGTHAAWPARGGNDGLSPEASQYPPDFQSWMVYGPFSLQDARTARLSFDIWRELLASGDFLFAGASNDGINYSGRVYSNQESWVKKDIDLTAFSGDASVWIMFLFSSDSEGQMAGPWIDNILVEKTFRYRQVYLPITLR
jgi:hypothetical protein